MPCHFSLVPGVRVMPGSQASAVAQSLTASPPPLPPLLISLLISITWGILLSSGQPHSPSVSSSSKSVNFCSKPPRVQWLRCLANHIYEQKYLPLPKYPMRTYLTVLFLSKQHVMLCLSNSSHTVGTLPFPIMIRHERLSEGWEEGHLNTASPGWRCCPANESPVLESGTSSILSIL